MLIAGHGPQHLPAVHVRHHQIKQHEVGETTLQYLQCLLAARGGDNLQIAIAGVQHALKEPQGVGVVVHNKHSLQGLAQGMHRPLQLGPRNGFHQITD